MFEEIDSFSLSSIAESGSFVNEMCEISPVAIFLALFHAFFSFVFLKEYGRI